MTSAGRRVAICHEWTLSRYGSEKVAARLAHALDAHDVYTFAVDEAVAKDIFPACNVRSSKLGRTAFVKRNWRFFLPLMPRWWRRLDLSAFDLVVSSSHAMVNSVRVRPGTVRICYCHTPMRYAWMWRSELRRLPLLVRPVWPAVAALLRRGDRRRAQNVDHFVANSQHVAERIGRYYGRESLVVHPPVDTEFFSPDPSVAKEDFYLYAGRLVAYKRPDIAVDAARMAGFRLVIAGTGPELHRLQRRAGPTVEFRDAPTSSELRDLYRRARAVVFPGVEDFGIALVEAQACGTPMIALGAGGAVEAVRNGVTGMLYDDPSPNSLAAAVKAFDESRYDVAAIRAHAEGFGAERFDSAIREIVHRVMDGGKAIV